MRERALEEFAVLEAVTDAPFQLGDRGDPRVHFRTLKNRLGWRFRTQVQGLKIEAPGFQESRMICALPSKFSAGTKPTPPASGGTRLSSELSRLSPIMK